MVAQDAPQHHGAMSPQLTSRHINTRFVSRFRTVRNKLFKSVSGRMMTAWRCRDQSSLAFTQKLFSRIQFLLWEGRLEFHSCDKDTDTMEESESVSGHDDSKEGN